MVGSNSTESCIGHANYELVFLFFRNYPIFFNTFTQ